MFVDSFANSMYLFPYSVSLIIKCKVHLHLKIEKLNAVGGRIDKTDSCLTISRTISTYSCVIRAMAKFAPARDIM